MTGVQFLAGAGIFRPRYRIMTGSGAHPAFRSVGTGGSFPGIKVAGA
jgi:hypothetical protein